MIRKTARREKMNAEQTIFIQFAFRERAFSNELKNKPNISFELFYRLPGEVLALS